MKTLALAIAAITLPAAAVWAQDCKFCASEIVVRAAQLDCLKQRLDQAAREIGDKNTVLIDLLNCGRPGQSLAPQTQGSPAAPPPVAGAPQTAGPAHVYRLTRAGLQCAQRQLGALPPSQDPIRLSTNCG